MDYALLDSGQGQKLERFGSYVFIRPSAQAVWQPQLSQTEWQAADAYFSREESGGWKMRYSLPESWTISLQKLQFQLKRTDFGHLGIFPEHSQLWPWMEEAIRSLSYTPKVLNLFAYSGGATLACARAGAEVCHLDAAKGMVKWARDNAALNHLEQAPIRWIVDDVLKYLARALRRQERYDAIILDPPTFGRGSAQEIFKIERDLPPILATCRNLLSDRPLFLLLTCHTPGFTPLVLEQLLQETFGKNQGNVLAGEMVIPGTPFSLPSGTYARWTP